MGDNTSIEGMVIDKYKIVKKLGAGAMGAVFRAQDTYTNEDVALKILAPKLAKDDTYLRRFKREVRAARELNHENIIRVFDAGEYKGFHYFTMEFVDGKSVMDFIEKDKRLPIRMSLEVIYQVAKALDHAASLNIVHRDIKPANIIVAQDKRVKLADMGLAKKVGESGYTAITMAGKIMGTPFYLAPERISEEGDNIDARADIYSLGATLYHMITGTVPFSGDRKNPFKVYHQIIHEQVQFPSDPPIPDHVKKLILKMMAKSVQDRYASPKALLQDLDRLKNAQQRVKVPSEEARIPSSAKNARPTIPSAAQTKGSPNRSTNRQRMATQSGSTPKGGGSKMVVGFVVGFLVLLGLFTLAVVFAEKTGVSFLVQLKKAMGL